MNATGSNQADTAEKTLHECKCTHNRLNELETELNSVRDSRDKLQEENNRLTDQWIKVDYRIENMKKRIEDLGKTLKLYETENKAFRELVRLWI